MGLLFKVFSIQFLSGKNGIAEKRAIRGYGKIARLRRFADDDLYGHGKQRGDRCDDRKTDMLRRVDRAHISTCDLFCFKAVDFDGKGRKNAGDDEVFRRVQ